MRHSAFKAFGIILSLLSSTSLGCHVIPRSDPCEEVDCAGHGVCLSGSETAVCQCDPGYEPVGLECLHAGADGDADPDTPAADGDSDVDTDTDVDIDADSDVDGHAGADADGDAGGNRDAGEDGDADSDLDGDADAELDACSPDCAGRECGLDPVCGTRCGPACFAAETCSPDGRCVRGVPGTWATVGAGTFWMGSPEAELGRWRDETLHGVTLSYPFEILSSEVTQGDFEAVMGYNPSYFPACGADCPVSQVNWHEAAAYCNALSDASSLGQCYDCAGMGSAVTCTQAAAYGSPYDCPGYRLPTESEWEYAARAGTRTATYNGDLDVTTCAASAVLDPIAWHCGNSGDETHPVGTRDSSLWGLYDMLGNVSEWCHDWYGTYPGSGSGDPWGPGTGTTRVIRGGGFTYEPRYCRAALREALIPEVRMPSMGFRPARSLR